MPSGLIVSALQKIRVIVSALQNTGERERPALMDINFNRGPAPVVLRRSLTLVNDWSAGVFNLINRFSAETHSHTVLGCKTSGAGVEGES
jgi:hypothetical protein